MARQTIIHQMIRTVHAQGGMATWDEGICLQSLLKADTAHLSLIDIWDFFVR